MDLKMSGYVGIDDIEELAKLYGSMPTMELTDDFAALGIESRKQRGRAVAFVIMSAPFGLAGSHRQQRLSVVQSLDLAFLIVTEDQSAVRRIALRCQELCR